MIPLLPWMGETDSLADPQKEDHMGKVTPKCPGCSSGLSGRDGKDRNGKQRYRCKVCGKTYIVQRDGVNPVVREIASALILEGVAVPTVAKAMSGYCSRRWLYNLKSSLINAPR